jgi:hypothetical protein
VFTPRSTPSAAIALVAALTAGFVPARAWSADPADIEKLIRQGVELRRAHDDHQALPLFQKAYDLAPTPRTAAQLGLAESSLGYVVEAERHLRESVAATHDPWVRRNRKALEDAFRSVRGRIGDVSVTGGPAGAEVRLNGAPVGKLPLTAPLRVAEGPAKVEVQAPGYDLAQRSITVTGGRRTTVAIELEPHRTTPIGVESGRLSTAPPTVSVVPSPVTLSSPAPGVSKTFETKTAPLASANDEPSPDEGSPLRASRPSLARPAAWALSVGAGAAVGFGVYETLAWSRRKDEFESHSKFFPDRQQRLRDCGTSVPGRGGPDCESLYDSASRARNLLILGYATGGALALGAAILFVVSSAPDDETSHAFACGPGWMATVCRGSF